MSEMPPKDTPSTPRGADDEPHARRRRFLPVWLWVVLAGILVAIVAIVAIPLISGSGDGVATTPTPSDSSSPTASPTPSTTSTPTPTASDVGQGTFDSAMVEFVTDTLNSQNTAVLAQGGTFSNPVSVVVAHDGSAESMSPDDAVHAMGSMFTPLDPNPWDLALSDSVLASYRSGPYGEYFPEGAIVATSHDGHVFSFIGHDRTITTMFMAASEDLLT